MKSFRRMMIVVFLLVAAVFLVANMALLQKDSYETGRPYLVEVNRIAWDMEETGLEWADLSGYQYVTKVEKLEFPEDADRNRFMGFYTDSDYVIREVNGCLYRFDYSVVKSANQSRIVFLVNVLLGCMALVFFVLLYYIRRNILLPFERLTNVPYELSKGNLTAPLEESKNRFFGRFLWGVDLLRENIEQQKQKELALHKERKTLLLSLSHDIKTPLSAIKLYAKALSKGLYTDQEKQQEIAENINKKADEIEGYVSRIISASREEFLQLEVTLGEFYLSELVGCITGYYREKLALVKTDFVVDNYSDCMLKGDLDRSIEVVQNVMENALKYGDGKRIVLRIEEEDGCILLSVHNGGCELADTEIPHIFESFWRGANAERQQGSGLGLYISRQLMNKMGGEIFAEVREKVITVTLVFGKA